MYRCKLIDGEREAEEDVAGWSAAAAASAFAEHQHHRWAWEVPEAYPMRVTVSTDNGQLGIFEVDREVAPVFTARPTREADKSIETGEEPR